ncbi:MBL fold metallo-hydrolase [Microbacteriaceae bacterium VKM Ac-2855]|nr:MBL fold metallo-hydrolase [Microbacteriaceae bacterium VKM Ac-2855]
MRLTKLEHATLLIDENGKRLVIDPGSFTAPLPDSSDTVAIVITHEHADHWTPEHLQRVLAANPTARILGPAGVASAASDFDIEVVADGDTVEVGPFRLRFFGARHAVIHSSIPVIDNVGVLVNDAFYYAGDSFTVPEGVEVDTLAAPAGAPWMKLAESMDYVLALSPRRAFSTHEMVLSEAGKQLSHSRIGWATEQGGGEYRALAPEQTWDI